MADSRSQRTVIMCAEAVPWRCHRSLVADMLTIRGWTVQHIVNRNEVHVHSLSTFAVEQGSILIYHSSPGPEQPAGLFWPTPSHQLRGVVHGWKLVHSETLT